MGLKKKKKSWELDVNQACLECWELEPQLPFPRGASWICSWNKGSSAGIKEADAAALEWKITFVISSADPNLAALTGAAAAWCKAEIPGKYHLNYLHQP